MGDIASKVLANDDVPGWAVSSVKFLLYMRCNVFLDVVFLECGGRDIDGLLLHLLAHVDILYDGLWWRGADEVWLSGSCGGVCGRRRRVHFVWHEDSGRRNGYFEGTRVTVDMQRGTWSVTSF